MEMIRSYIHPQIDVSRMSGKSSSYPVGKLPVPPYIHTLPKLKKSSSRKLCGSGSCKRKPPCFFIAESNSF
ncbi:hypothetical protein Nmel_002513 [Mimus melanotis]